MFFVLSKILDFLLQPICWLILLLTYSIFKINVKRLKKLLCLVLFLLIVLSNGFFTNLFFNMWEIPYKKQIDTKYTYGIVLTGGIMLSSGVEDPDIHFGDQSDRLIQAYLLFKKGIIEKIIISGGNVSIPGSLVKDVGRESDKSKEFLKIAGVPDSCIIVEGLSRNTFENAKNSANLIRKYVSKSDKILLITSSYHMRRASACFTKQGVAHDVFPAYKKGKDASTGILENFIPNEEKFFLNAELIHEIAGYCIYKLMGYC